MGRGSRALLGLLMIAGGLLYLLINTGLVTINSLTWAGLFGVAGITFLGVFATDRSNWWSAIPGLTLLGLSGLIGLQELIQDVPGSLGAGLFLASIGLSFWLIYLTNHAHWWAVIPGGVLWSVAVVAGLADIFQDFELGGFLFFGLGLTFALVAVLPSSQGKMSWAWVPAGILLTIGVLTTAAITQGVDSLWPLGLVLAGIFLIVRSFSTGSRS